MFVEYKKDLESAVKKGTSGDLRDLLIKKLSGGSKEEKSDVDEEKAEEDAKTLHEVKVSFFFFQVKVVVWEQEIVKIWNTWKY